jgi:DNA ligase 1
MLLADVVAASQQAAATSKRSEKVVLFAEVLRRAAPAEAAIVVGLLTASPRQGSIGVGWASLAGAVGPPAADATLTIADVDRALTNLAATIGEGSQRRRAELIGELFGAATAPEQRFVRSVLTGELRHGAGDGVVAEAVAKAASAPIASLRRAAMLLGDLGVAAERAIRGEPLDTIGLTPLVGVQPMLAGAAASVADALAVTGPASVEWKLDGARIQVHRDGDQVRVFTRSLREIGGAVPNIVRAALSLPSSRFVLDGEALGLNDDGTPLIFQDSMSTEAALRPFFFDLLHLDGSSMIDLPLAERRQALTAAVPDELLLPTLTTGDAAAADEFAKQAVAAGHEGVMVKSLESTYQAGRRGVGWRKVKPVHTLDLVVLAAEWGHGRRTGWLSNLHLGARGADGEFVMVGKTFKGLTDALLKWQTEQLQARALGEPERGYIQHVRPELVVEIAVDGVQRSSRYPGGVALRFARVRRYRDDKGPDEADTIERVQAMLAGRP